MNLARAALTSAVNRAIAEGSPVYVNQPVDECAIDDDAEEVEYTFDQLDDRAKEKARDWFREGYPDNDWWDSVYDDADTIACMLGITIATKPVQLMNGTTRHDPAIYFSGFSCQGDGACFDGSWSPVSRPMSILDKVLDHAPQDERLQEIALDIAHLAERCAIIPDAWARSRHHGNYCHSGYAAIEFELPTPYHVDEDNELQVMVWNALVMKAGLDAPSFEEEITRLLRSFMDWIYRQLEAEHTYLTSEENVDECILANDYRFDEDGNHI